MATRIPITKDYNFDDRQKKVWEDMERDMERRRREWEDEIDRMRKDFFTMRPDPPDFGRALDSSGTLSRLPARMSGRVQEEDDGKAIIEKDEHGQPMFKVRFNMKDYKPEEVNVKMDSSKIMVSARHEEKSEGSTVSREYSREVNIPRDVDPLALQCTLNPDGYLVVHAPLPVPGYSAIKDSGSTAQHPAMPPGNTSTVVSSSSSYYSSPSGGLNKMSSSYQTSSTSSTTSSSGRPQLQPQSSLPSYLHHQEPQFHHHQQQQQQHQHQQQSQVKSHITNQQHAAPPTHHGNHSTFIQSNSSHSNTSGSAKPQSLTSSSRSESMREELMSHPDHVVPSYKPPPDLSKLDLAASTSTTSSSHQMRSSPIPPALRQTHAPPASSPTPSSSSATSHHQHQHHYQQQQQHQRDGSSAGPNYHNPPTFPTPPPFGTPTLMQPPTFSAPPPFSSLSSAFPTGPLFPDSTAQVNQLSTPQVTSHDGKFQLTMPIEDFKPEELTVKTQDGKVVICASREVKDGNRSQSSEMSREHSLPSNVDPLTVKAFFTDTGNLIVEAPFMRS